MHISWYNPWENTSSTVASYRKNDTSFYTPVIFEKGATSSASPTADASLTNKKYVDDSIASAVSTKADLVNGIVPSTQLPSYVDAVIEFNEQVGGSYWYKDAVSSSVAIGKMVFNKATASDLDGGASSPYYKKFLRKISEPDTAWESSPESHKEDYYGCMEAVAPENGKIYVSLSNEACYRWSGTNLVEISKSIALGETPSTAYAGDKGKANAEAIASLQASKADKEYVDNAISLAITGALEGEY